MSDVTQASHRTLDRLATAIERRPGSGVAAVVLLVPGGTSAESSMVTGGEAHLIEHCTLRTWFTRAEQHGRPFDLTGASPRAHTTKEYWIYSALVLRDDVELAVSTVLEAVACPDFSLPARATEHSRITRELSSLRMRPLVVEIDRAEREILAGTRLGRSEFDRNPTHPPSRDALLRCLEQGSAQGRPVLAVVGDVRDTDLTSSIDHAASEPDSPVSGEDIATRPHGVRIRSADAHDRGRLVIGSTAPAFAQDGSAAAATLAALLGSGYESELARESRESGLFYLPYAQYARYREAGTVILGVATESSHLDRAEERLLRRIASIAEGTSTDRIHAARERLRATTLLRLNDPLVAAHRLAVAHHHTGRCPAGAVREIEEVRPETVAELARDLLSSATRTIDIASDERTATR